MSYLKSLKKPLREGALDDNAAGNYMFFSNLKQIQRQCEILLSQDHSQIENLLNNGHDWADDHLTGSKEYMDQVFDFFMNELNIKEMSTSAGAGAYDTPNAFGELPDANVEMLGYKKAKKKKGNTVTNESAFKRLSRELYL